MNKQGKHSFRGQTAVADEKFKTLRRSTLNDHNIRTLCIAFGAAWALAYGLELLSGLRRFRQRTLGEPGPLGIEWTTD